MKTDISDKKCLLQLTSTDIADLKLSVGDRRRLVDGLEVLQNPKGQLPSTPGVEATREGDLQQSISASGSQVGLGARQ